MAEQETVIEILEDYADTRDRWNTVPNKYPDPSAFNERIRAVFRTPAATTEGCEGCDSIGSIVFCPPCERYPKKRIDCFTPTGESDNG